MKSRNKKIFIVMIVCSLAFFSFLLLKPKEESEEALMVIAGYYWSGMIDERERLSSDQEAIYQSDYLDITNSTKKVFDPRYNWVEVGAVSAKNVQNGDYVQVYFTGPILELYPAKLRGVVKIEVVVED